MNNAVRPDLWHIMLIDGARWPHRFRAGLLLWVTVFVVTASWYVAVQLWRTHGAAAGVAALALGGAWLIFSTVIGRRWTKQQQAWVRADKLSRAGAFGYSEGEVDSCQKRLERLGDRWMDENVHEAGAEAVRSFHRARAAAIIAVERTKSGLLLARIRSAAPYTGALGMVMAGGALVLERSLQINAAVQVFGTFGLLLLAGSVLVPWLARKLIEPLYEREFARLSAYVEISE